MCPGSGCRAIAVWWPQKDEDRNTSFWSVKDMAHPYCLGRSCTRAGERLRRDFHTRDADLGVTQGQLSAQGFPGWFGM